MEPKDVLTVFSDRFLALLLYGGIILTGMHAANGLSPSAVFGLTAVAVAFIVNKPLRGSDYGTIQLEIVIKLDEDDFEIEDLNAVPERHLRLVQAPPEGDDPPAE